MKTNSKFLSIPFRFLNFLHNQTENEKKNIKNKDSFQKKKKKNLQSKYLKVIHRVIKGLNTSTRLTKQKRRCWGCGITVPASVANFLGRIRAKAATFPGKSRNFLEKNVICINGGRKGEDWGRLILGNGTEGESRRYRTRVSAKDRGQSCP